MDRKVNVTRLIAETCRLLVGVVFVFSGFVKAVDPMGFEIKTGEYLSAWGIEGWDMLAGLVSFGLIAVEFMTGVCLLLGVYRRYVSVLALALMGFMTPLTLYVALFDPVTDCGCFGDAIVISNWATFWKNIVLLSAAWFVYVHHGKVLSCFTVRTRWFVPLFAFTGCLYFAYWNYSHLPMIDFRPYKTGVNIAQQMSIPEGAEEDEYSYSFVYEKDGARKTFSLDNYPAGDSSWTFVESQTVLLKKGYTPPIAAFNIYDLEGDDVTGLILSQEGDVLLLIAPRLEKASDERAGDISNLYDYAGRRGIPFYCVTGSAAGAIDKWTEETGAEYTFLAADETLLKTIIRSNPGLVWLRNGTIIRKWHYKDMPDEDDMASLMASPLALSPEAGDSGRGGRVVVSICCFALPLLSVWTYDFIRFRRRQKAEADRYKNHLQ